MTQNAAGDVGIARVGSIILTGHLALPLSRLIHTLPRASGKLGLSGPAVIQLSPQQKAPPGRYASDLPKRR
jgi:hypothetical protein